MSKFYFLLVMIAFMATACENNTTTGSNQQKPNASIRKINCGVSHNQMLDKIYAKMNYDFKVNNMQIDQNELVYYVNKTMAKVFVEEGMETSYESYLEKMNKATKGMNPASSIEDALLNARNEVEFFYNNKYIGDEEYMISLEIIEALGIDDYDTAYQKLVNIKNNMEKQGFYGTHIIATYAIDVGISSAEYWKLNFDKWNILYENMVKPAKGSSRALITAGVFAFDCLGAFVGAGVHIKDNIDNPGNVTGAVWDVVTTSASFSSGKLWALAGKVGEWLFR